MRWVETVGSMDKLLFATLGTAGDVRPMAALAQAAAQAGRRAIFAAPQRHAPLAARLGLDFVSLGPDAYWDDPVHRQAIADPERGFETFLALANLEDFGALLARLDSAAEGALAIVASPFVMAAHLVAERRGLPLINIALSPAMLMAQEGRGPRPADPNFHLWRRLLSEHRHRLGLPRRLVPQMERLTGAGLTLGLYPALLTPEPGATLAVVPLQLGYPLLRASSLPRLEKGLDAWMARGPFVLVSFGSFVDTDASRFLDFSLQACRRLGLRCLYASPYAAARLASQDEYLRIEPYAPHDLVMPRAAAVVHHGGMGSLAEALEARTAAVVSPFGLDQPYNARRLAEADLAERLPAADYDSESLATALAAALAARNRRAARLGELGFGQGRDHAAAAVAEITRFLSAEPALSRTLN